MKTDKIKAKVAAVRAALDEIESMLGGAMVEDDSGEPAATGGEDEEEGEMPASRILLRSKLARLKG